MNCNNNNEYNSPEEWKHRCELEIKSFMKQQESAQRLVREARRLVKQTKQLAVNNKQETDYQAKVKVNDTDYKCNEIEKKIFDLEEELELLSNYQMRIEKANKLLLGDSLDVIAECLRLRKCRKSIDLVFDDVEKELLKERELILDVKDQLEELLEKVILQIRKLRPLVYYLSEDLRLKKNTLKIEAHNEELNEKCFNDFSVLNIKNLFKPATISTMEWDQYTSDMLRKTDQILVDSRPIRAFFDKCLSKIIEDLTTQSNVVNKALTLRVDEYRIVIEKLNKQKAEMNENIAVAEKTIKDLIIAVNTKQPSRALASTRLFNRSGREGIENCRDEIEVQLHSEVTQLDNSEQDLRKMIGELETCVRHLKQTSIRTDIQLEIKNNTLHIDSVLCFNQRKRISYQSY